MAPNGSRPFPFRLMTGVLITALVVSSVRSAWGASAAEDVGREITVAAFGWPEDLRAAIDTYRKSRPQVHFTLLVHESGKIEGFRDFFQWLSTPEAAAALANSGAVPRQPLEDK